MPLPKGSFGMRSFLCTACHVNDYTDLGLELPLAAVPLPVSSAMRPPTLTVEAELTGDLAFGPALGRQRDDGMLQAHVELVHRAGLRLPPHPTQHRPQSGWL